LELNKVARYVTECVHFIFMFKMDYLHGISSDKSECKLSLNWHCISTLLQQTVLSE